MNDLIKPHSFSVGYNLTGQEFFDTISTFSNYIHSYFFSLTEDVHGKPFDADEVLNTLSNCERYGIKGNLLLNTFDTTLNYRKYIQPVVDNDIINAVTIIDPRFATNIKKEFPELEIHISVRYWDWLGDRDSSIRLSPGETIFDLKQCGIDVVNISGELHFNNNNVINMIHDHDMKSKIIINEGCIIGREYNYNNFNGFANLTCKGNKCKHNCYKVFEKYPWMKLSRIELFKEDLLYHDYDILKVASRMISNSDLYTILSNWIFGSRTTKVFDIYISDEKYLDFLKWINTRSQCYGDCNYCRKCESIYNKLIT